MGFVSFNLSYYKQQLQNLENTEPTNKRIYFAKQLLKIIDDLQAEGYDQLSMQMQANFNGVSRLKKYIADNGGTAFKIKQHNNAIKLNTTKIELTDLLNNTLNMAKNYPLKSKNRVISKLKEFCDWIGYDSDKAYIFLLRDTALAYINYSYKGKSNVYPWVISRKFINSITGKENVDDKFRTAIYNALEKSANTNFNQFFSYVSQDMLLILNDYPKLKDTLQNLLNKIKQKHIIVVESGCSGTFPLLLKSLDNRVDFRMFTTYPYLQDIYKGKVFCEKYEQNQLVESLSFHDQYFEFADFTDNKFYVQKTVSKCVQNKVLSEVAAIIKDK